MNSLDDAIIGCILGTAVGDAIGLPFEGLSPLRAARLLGAPDSYRFFFGRGMISDDTEHTCLIAQSLIESGSNVEEFSRSFLRRLRYWLLTCPAGAGLATVRSILRSMIGYSPERCGVFSAGNGPAMRSAIVGAATVDRSKLKTLIRASCTLTHTDPKAFFGAAAVALAAQLAARREQLQPADYANELNEFLKDEGCVDFLEAMRQCVESVETGNSTEQFARSMGLSNGVTGYVYHTVPVAIHAWLTHQKDLRAAVITVVRCGGDADTTAAIVGGIVGSNVGRTGIPKDWLDRLIEYPRNVEYLEQLGTQLARSISNSISETPLKVHTVAVLLRNFAFLNIVLFHGFRRLLPPY